MLFTLLILVGFGAIVFFHYIQGFFSAALSAILAVFAAVVAFSYHESIVPLFGGKVGDFADGLTLLALFALIYIVLRVAFDKMIPGNIRLPVAVDKGGAAVMGIIAAIFATGIVAIGAQEMPFNADIAGFTRYDVSPKRQVRIEQKGRQVVSETWDELSATTPGTAGSDEHGVSILPVDNAVIGLVDKLSGPAGSLSNGKPLYTVHPDFLGEMFDQRLGIETGGARTATNGPGSDSVRLEGLFTVSAKIAEADMDPTLRAGGPLKEVRPNASQLLVAVRIGFGSGAADKDTFVRFSPGSCRLLVHDPQADDPEKEFQNYYPIGTLEGTDRLLLNKLDDFLYCNTGKGADLVYLVPKRLFDKNVPRGSFLEVKRWARIDLSGKAVEPTLVASADVAVIRPSSTPTAAPGAAQSTPAASTPAPAAASGTNPPPSSAAASASAPPAVASGAEFEVGRVSVLEMLPTPLAIPVKGGGDTQQVPPNGYVKFNSDHQIKNSVMDAALSELNGSRKIIQFAVPDKSSMVQISGKVSSTAPWAFATESEQYELVDTQGKHYPPNGIWAVYRGSNGDHILCRYIDSTGISGAAAPEGNPPPPSQVVLLFIVPKGVTLKELDDHGKKVHEMNQLVN